MTTNYNETAETMRKSLSELPGWTVGELCADEAGWSFTVSRAPSSSGHGRRMVRVPGFTETRHVSKDGTLTVTRHG